MAPASLSLPICEVGTLTLTLQVIVRSKGTTWERVFAASLTDHAVNSHHIKRTLGFFYYWFLPVVRQTTH